MTDTTAQLRRKTLDLIVKFEHDYQKTKIFNDWTLSKELMHLFADYISQLELPEKISAKRNRDPNDPYERDDYLHYRGYDQAIDDTASTLQKAVESLRNDAKEEK